MKTTQTKDIAVYKRPDTLIHLSGGQDSTYALYTWLRDNPEKKCIVHHVNLKHRAENRLEPEYNSVHNILTWLRRNGLGNFHYLESSFDYGDLPRISIKDIQVVAMFTGIILRTPGYKDVRNVILSWHKGEVNSSAINRGQKVRQLLEGLFIGPERYELHFPLEDINRKDMAQIMPIELLKMCHCCRKPLPGAKSCGQCRTCMELKEAGIYEIVGQYNRQNKTLINS
jgi:tRNA(Ile)-lysidine synthase TilS/MesJ